MQENKSKEWKLFEKKRAKIKETNIHKEEIWYNIGNGS